MAKQATAVPLTTGQTFQDGDGQRTASVAIPAGTTGASAHFEAGPMPDPTQHIAMRIMVDKQDGAGFVNTGAGLEGWGGLTGPKGQTPTIPVTITADVMMPLQPGWRILAEFDIDNSPSGIPVIVNATLQ
jgi:hypothetical protein